MEGRGNVIRVADLMDKDTEEEVLGVVVYLGTGLTSCMEYVFKGQRMEI